MKKWYLVSNLIRTTRSLDISYNDGENNITLMSSAQVIVYMENVFDGFLYKTTWDESKTKSANITSAATSFIALWRMHFDVKQDDLNRFFRLLYGEYNPLINYRMSESGQIIDELHKAHTETETYDHVTDALTGGGSDTSTPTVKTRSSDFVAGADSTTGVLSTYNETETVSGNLYNVNTHDSTNVRTGAKITEVADTDAEHFDKNVHTFDEYNREGNTGIYTQQALIIEERKLRMQNYIYRLIDEFMKYFCIYFCPFDEEDIVE